MKRVILSYPEDFVNLEEEASSLSSLGLLIHPNEEKLTISTLFDEGKLEKIFTGDAIAKYTQSGIDVEIVE